MGKVDIPPDPVSGGRLSIHIDLSVDELQTTVRLLSEAAQKMLQKQNPASVQKPVRGQQPPAGPLAASQQPAVARGGATGGLPTAALQDLDAEVSSIAMRFKGTSLQQGQQATASANLAAQHYRTPDPASTSGQPVPTINPSSRPAMPLVALTQPRTFPHPTPPSQTYQPPPQPPVAAVRPLAHVPPASYRPHPTPTHPPARASMPHAAPPPPRPAAAPQQYHAPAPPRPQQYHAPAPPHPQQYPPAPVRPQYGAPSSQHTWQAARPDAAVNMAGHRVQVRAPAWTNCYKTDAADHNGDAVMALAYCPAFDSLPGGDGHGGWLISSSRHLLNLWECSRGGSFKGEPSLMLMHSQMTDFITSHIALELGSQQMFGCSRDTRAGSECVSVHSLGAAAFLSYRYRYLLGSDQAPQQRGRRPASLLQQVVSLHVLGGQMRNCCAASYDNQIYVFEAAAHSAAAQAPRAEWKAHDSVVTVLHRSPFGSTLFSGAQDGSIHMWNLKERLVHPQKRLSHQQQVTGIQHVNDHTLVTSSLDTKVLLWDLRMPAAPVRTICPDGTGIAKLAASPVGDCVAAATQRGLVLVDLIDLSGDVTRLLEKPLPQPFSDLLWNTRTDELYASAPAGDIYVYRQKYH